MVRRQIERLGEEGGMVGAGQLLFLSRTPTGRTGGVDPEIALQGYLQALNPLEPSTELNLPLN